jgi:hypothetical protein
MRKLWLVKTFIFKRFGPIVHFVSNCLRDESIGAYVASTSNEDVGGVAFDADLLPVALFW